eukprot:10410872-Lingulodinium_polyedra.AAC.1
MPSGVHAQGWFCCNYQARGPDRGDARQAQVFQASDYHSHWAVKEGEEVLNLVEWEVRVIA